MTFYLLDKEKDITSNKTLKNFMRDEGIKKAGFSGVLDPFATGLLIIATDGDTKFIERFLKSDKTYTGEILFGKETDTLDIDGKVILESDEIVNQKNLQDVINNNFIGEIEQIPPKFSNIKVNGVRAHKLSRNNSSFELKPVKRKIISFTIIKFNNNVLKFKVVVSSGTYIRSIARDLGKKIGVPAMLISLRRESIGEITLGNKKISKINRDEILDIDREEISDKKMRDLLDGKIVDFDKEKEEYIMYGDNKVVWVREINSGKYKIKKRIE